MWSKAIRRWVVSAILGGLCASAAANTTVAADPALLAQDNRAIQVETSAIELAYNDITLFPEETAIQEATPYAVPLPYAAPAPIDKAYPAQPLNPAGPLRIALLLPLSSPALNEVADAVRRGFFAAHETERERGISISVLHTGEAEHEVLQMYREALPAHDIVVGPLTRSAVTALAHSGMVSKPTLALAQPEESPAALPARMLTIGLSLEDEARQVANWAQGAKAEGAAFILSTSAAWQRRAAKAFGREWSSLGYSSRFIELGLLEGYLNPNDLVTLRQRVKDERPALLFAALDAAQVRQVREAVGAELPIFGTSQLNPFPLQSEEEVERLPFLNGIRLVDMPWQLQADHAAVMIYPRPSSAPGERRSANADRFYALGIDAYRIAKEIARGRSNFQLDGVTGRLQINLGSSAPSFERSAVPAIYRNGVVVPLTGQ